MSQESNDSLQFSVSSIDQKAYDTMSPTDLAELMKDNPMAVAIWLKQIVNNDRNVNLAQESKISALASKVKKLEAYKKDVESFRSWAKGVMWTLGVLFPLVSFVVPWLVKPAKKEAQRALCRQVQSCELGGGQALRKVKKIQK